MAARLRETFLEVLGEDAGSAIYTPEWLRERVLWHLNPLQAQGKVVIAESTCGSLGGQALARIERNELGEEYGYVSTLYVDPRFRNQGIATRFLVYLESWFLEKNLPKMIYTTSRANLQAIQLFRDHGFVASETSRETMLLTKNLAPLPTKWAEAMYYEIR